MTDETVLRAQVGEWLLGPADGAPRIELTVVSAGGKRTVVAEAEAAAGDYALVRSEPSTE